jgi:hypothetical protein
VQPTRSFKHFSAIAMACILLLVTSALVQVQAQQASPDCNCSEMRNVRNRVCGTRAAQREYDRIASKFLAEEKRTGKPILLTSDIKDSIKACVQEVMVQSQDMGAQDASGETDTNCKVTVNSAYKRFPGSRCVEGSVRRHEEHHRRECLARQDGKWQKVWTTDAPVKSALIDTKFAMSVVDYTAEEAAAYSMEESEMKDTLRNLNNTCKPTEKVVTIQDDDDVWFKKKGDKLSLDLSVDSCTYADRKKTPECKF